MAAARAIADGERLREIIEAEWDRIESDSAQLIERLSFAAYTHRWRELDGICTDLRIGARAWDHEFMPRLDEREPVGGATFFVELWRAGMTVGEMRELSRRLDALPGATLQSAEAWVLTLRQRLEALAGQLALAEERVAALKPADAPARADA